MPASTCRPGSRDLPEVVADPGRAGAPTPGRAGGAARLHRPTAAGRRVVARAARRLRARSASRSSTPCGSATTRWFPLSGRRPADPARRRRRTTSRRHPFLAQAILDGRVTHGSRAALAADPGARSGRHGAGAGRCWRPRGRRPPHARRHRRRTRPRRDGGWSAWSPTASSPPTRPTSTTPRWPACSTRCDDRALRGRGLVAPMTRGRARAAVGFWTEVLRRSPPRVGRPAGGAARLVGLAARQRRARLVCDRPVPRARPGRRAGRAGGRGARPPSPTRPTSPDLDADGLAPGLRTPRRRRRAPARATSDTVEAAVVAAVVAVVVGLRPRRAGQRTA